MNINKIKIKLLIAPLLFTTLAIAVENNQNNAEFNEGTKNEKSNIEIIVSNLQDVAKKDSSKIQSAISNNLNYDSMKKELAHEDKLSNESFDEKQRKELVEKIDDRLSDRNTLAIIKREECRKIKVVSEVQKCLKEIQ